MAARLMKNIDVMESGFTKNIAEWKRDIREKILLNDSGIFS